MIPDLPIELTPKFHLNVKALLATGPIYFNVLGKVGHISDGSSY